MVSRRAVLRAGLDLTLPRAPVADDVSVAAYVGARLGHEVVDRIVEPLLGGVYAGRADELSLRATLPAVAAVSDERSLLRALHGRPRGAAGPVFAGFAGGVGQLAEMLTATIEAAGATVGCSARLLVNSPGRRPAGAWSPARPPRPRSPRPTPSCWPFLPHRRRVCSRVAFRSPHASLRAIDYASMAVVSLAFSASAFEKPLSGSGFLVPAVEGRLIKAGDVLVAEDGVGAPGDLVLVRCSVGRHGDVADLQRSDDEIVSGAVRGLAAAVGVRGVPRDAVVTRWGGALPQYEVGHLERVERISAAVEACRRARALRCSLAGVGIPACIASGQSAATRLLGGLFREGR